MPSTFVLLMAVVVSLNVNGMHNNAKWSNIFNTVLVVNPFIVAFQETHLLDLQEYLFCRAMPEYQIIFEHGTSNSAGILVAIKRNCGISIQAI